MNYRNPGASTALSMATIAFAANFSVWTLYAIMAFYIEPSLELSSTELGILLATPMFTGAVLRIPVGMMIEYFQPKNVFISQMILVAPGLFLLPHVNSFNAYLLLGLWIGISGTSFTIGIRYITDWFDRKQQGTAMGIFGAGNAGAAITFAGVPIIVRLLDWAYVGTIYGLGILLMAFVFYLFAPTTPSHLLAPPPGTFKQQLAPLKVLRVWRFGLYYYFVFGSFLALILWLPHYYHSAYNLAMPEALAFTLFFVTTSSMARALGGWFADRYGGRTVNWSVFWVCLVCLFFLSYPPTTMTVHGINTAVELKIEINVWAFTSLIFIIGIAQGFGRASVYKTIHDYYPQQMGSVGGLVGAIGALGGCTLPIIFGIATDVVGIYSVCFMVLYGLLAACMIAMYLGLKSDRYQQRLAEALNHNFLDDD